MNGRVYGQSRGQPSCASWIPAANGLPVLGASVTEETLVRSPTSVGSKSTLTRLHHRIPIRGRNGALARLRATKPSAVGRLRSLPLMKEQHILETEVALAGAVTDTPTRRYLSLEAPALVCGEAFPATHLREPAGAEQARRPHCRTDRTADRVVRSVAHFEALPSMT